MLVGVDVGDAIDVIARMLVERMKEYFPSFIVDNRPGAGGWLPPGALKGSLADGTAMIPGAPQRRRNPHVYESFGYVGTAG